MKKPEYIPGQRIDGWIYVGFIKDYHLLCKPNDEPEEMNWHGAMKLDLPTKEELALMYANKDLIGGFGDYWYWSSSESEYDTNYAWILRFSDGLQNLTNKNYNSRVRCVRRIPCSFDDSVIQKKSVIEDQILEHATALANCTSQVSFMVAMPEGKYEVSVKKVEP